MGPRDKSDRRSTKEAEHKSLCNNLKRGRSLKSMTKQTTQGGTHCRVKVKICGTLLLYPKERRFTMVGSRLQEVKPGHDKGQNATASNWKSNQQTQRDKIFQQVGLDLEIQQCTN